MKITPDAVTSSRTGVPTYTVTEDDRGFSWTINSHALLLFAAWDDLEIWRRDLAIHKWRSGIDDPSFPVNAAMPCGPGNPSLIGWRETADLCMLELHAIVARNHLRNYLGNQVAVIDRKFHSYAQPSGWLGFITVNGQVEAWITTDGEVIEDVRISYGHETGSPRPVSYVVADSGERVDRQ